MAVVYQTEIVEVFTTLFSSLFRVRHVPSGTVVKAPPAVQAKAAALMREVTTSGIDQELKSAVVGYLFERFAATVLMPDTLAASMFMESTTEATVAAVELAIRGEPPFTKEVAVHPGPTASLFPSHLQRHDLRNGMTLWWTYGTAEAWVLAMPEAALQQAKAADAEKMSEAYWALTQITKPGRIRDRAIEQLLTLFGLVVALHRREMAFFSERPAMEVARGVLVKAEADIREEYDRGAT